MSFPRYPKYKPSGVEWLGDVPEGWEVKPLKFVATYNDDVIDETTPPETEILYVDISAVDALDGIKMKEPMAFSAAPSRARRRVKHGDTIISTVRTYLRAIARVRTPEENLIVSTGFAVIRPRADLSPDYVGNVVSASYFIEQVIARSTGVGYPAINASDLARIPVAIPPLPEQTAIAEFLDRDTGKIDGLVAEQRRLMELLKEKRQAVIAHAVTKGINPHAPMKPSGIEWLGDVPAHWKIPRLGYCAKIENGTTPSRANPEYWSGGEIPWLSSGEVNQQRISEATEFITQKALDECSLRMLPKGTIVTGMIGQGKTRGLAASLEIEATINQNLAAIIPGKNLKSDYLLFIFQAVYEYLREFGRGGNQAALNCELLSTLKIPLPSSEEQLGICDCLRKRLREFDSLTTEAQRAIDLLQERRTALISAAVTGQIDVRQPTRN